MRKSTTPPHGRAASWRRLEAASECVSATPAYFLHRALEIADEVVAEGALLRRCAVLGGALLFSVKMSSGVTEVNHGGPNGST